MTTLASDVKFFVGSICSPWIWWLWATWSWIRR